MPVVQMLRINACLALVTSLLDTPLCVTRQTTVVKPPLVLIAALFLFACLGHFGLYVFAYNRVNALGYSRLTVKLIDKFILVFLMSLHLATAWVAWQWAWPMYQERVDWRLMHAPWPLQVWTSWAGRLRLLWGYRGSMRGRS